VITGLVCMLELTSTYNIFYVYCPVRYQNFCQCPIWKGVAVVEISAILHGIVRIRRC